LTVIFSGDQIVRYENENTICNFKIKYNTEEEINLLKDNANQFLPSRQLKIKESKDKEKDCELIFNSKVPEISVHKMFLAWHFKDVIYKGKHYDLDAFRSILSTAVK